MTHGYDVERKAIMKRLLSIPNKLKPKSILVR
jgi:hypothetical protein